MILTLLILAALIVWLYALYVSLIKTRNNVLEALSGIDVQLAKRHALVPNLVEAVKGAMGHERHILEDVTRLRAEAMAANIKAGGTETDAALGSEVKLAGALDRLFISIEAYPDLKTSQNMRDLQRALAEIEANISASRRFYNSAATSLKTQCETIPSAFIAQMIAIKPVSFFEAEPVMRNVPTVGLDGIGN